MRCGPYDQLLASSSWLINLNTRLLQPQQNTCGCKARVAAGDSPALSKIPRASQRLQKLARRQSYGYNDHHSRKRGSDVACPFFMPIEKLNGAWLRRRPALRPGASRILQYGLRREMLAPAGRARMRRGPHFGRPRSGFAVAFMVCMRDRPSPHKTRHAGVRRGPESVDVFAFRSAYSEDVGMLRSGIFTAQDSSPRERFSIERN